MTQATITERQQRERAYYDAFGSHLASHDEVSFEPISGQERRPWNPYWRVFELAQAHFAPGARLLDFGCGWGSNTVVFAKIGYRVDGFDISPKNVETTRALASQYGMGDRVTAQVSPAETLPYADAVFDAVVGVDILHHVDIARAIAEVRRTLKIGGCAIFREPLEQPIFDRLRNSPAGRWLRPNSPSLEQHITEDERKLDSGDLTRIRGAFPSLRIESFRMLSRLEALLPDQGRRLEKIDHALTVLPGYAWWRGTGILVMTRES